MNKVFTVDAVFVLILFFLVSMFLMPLYLYGDQIAYRNVYEHFAKADGGIVSDFLFYQGGIGGTEITHFIVTYISAKFGFTKDVVMTFFNALLFMFAYKAALGISKHKIVSFCVVVSNYYLYVMAFSAERLKFGFIFLFMYLVLKNRTYLMLSLISHFQIGLFLISGLSVSLVTSLRYIIGTGRVKERVVYLSIFSAIAVVVLIYKSNVLEKFNIYYVESSYDIISFLKNSLVLFLGLLCMNRRDRLLAVAPLLIVFVISTLLGTDRTLIVMYFIALSFCLRYQKGVNLFIVITSLYFAWSSLGFISNIIFYNDGFNL